MRLIAVMMLGLGMLSVEVADAASDETSRPPAPARATGALTDGEELLQGSWQMHSFESDKRDGTLRIDDRDFHADSIHGRYVGYVSIRPHPSPAEIDFTIEECECKFKGMTSTGIYYEDDGTIVFAGPAPGDPRPTAFTNMNELVRLRRPDPAAGSETE